MVLNICSLSLKAFLLFSGHPILLGPLPLGKAIPHGMLHPRQPIHYIFKEVSVGLGGSGL